MSLVLRDSFVFSQSLPIERSVSSRRSRGPTTGSPSSFDSAQTFFDGHLSTLPCSNWPLYGPPFSFCAALYPTDGPRSSLPSPTFSLTVDNLPFSLPTPTPTPPNGEGLVDSSQAADVTMAAAVPVPTTLGMLLALLAILGAAGGASAQTYASVGGCPSTGASIGVRESILFQVGCRFGTPPNNDNCFYDTNGDPTDPQCPYAVDTSGNLRIVRNACPSVAYVGSTPYPIQGIACVYNFYTIREFCYYNSRSGQHIPQMGVSPSGQTVTIGGCPGALVPVPQPALPTLLPTPTPTPSNRKANTRLELNSD
ncbi:hypothetical protein KFL_004080080 [Klebsormidium nitens]|uniref:Uncharacterized protein n=1 Tax=Klebsormidium nitens TaxID=105231 RepID=A0A1Y1IFE7_KLENI|nr:hypothetical protein KFL_004080080 [Klebsormidium nitens]|eukprot:GAQ88199.1 hypothetical protein KFL_004080080 [Klebsormidium nitens]